MSDWLGLLFFILPVIGIYVGLHLLSRPRTRTETEFERGAAKSASLLGAGIGALLGILDPREAQAKEVRIQMKEGRYSKKKREGKANGEDFSENND
ncbi:MAG: hypothetical protein ACR2N3_06450 [Pyrinomonadaceae bacterium]